MSDPLQDDRCYMPAPHSTKIVARCSLSKFIHAMQLFLF